MDIEVSNPSKDKHLKLRFKLWVLDVDQNNMNFALCVESPLDMCFTIIN
jgi:hypothetical protein